MGREGRAGCRDQRGCFASSHSPLLPPLALHRSEGEGRRGGKRWAAPEMCPGPLSQRKQAAHGRRRDKSPWLCPRWGLSCTVPWAGIMHRWQQISRGSSGTSSPQQQMYRWGCELLSWQHRAPGSPPQGVLLLHPFPWGCRSWGKNPAKGSNPAWETHARGGGWLGGTCSCAWLQAGGPGPPSPHLCRIPWPLRVPSTSARFPTQLLPPVGMQVHPGGHRHAGPGGPRCPAAGSVLLPLPRSFSPRCPAPSLSPPSPSPSLTPGAHPNRRRPPTPVQPGAAPSPPLPRRPRPCLSFPAATRRRAAGPGRRLPGGGGEGREGGGGRAQPRRRRRRRGTGRLRAPACCTEPYRAVPSRAPRHRRPLPAAAVSAAGGGAGGGGGRGAPLPGGGARAPRRRSPRRSAGREDAEQGQEGEPVRLPRPGRLLRPADG